jgi:hypothetical protein
MLKAAQAYLIKRAIGESVPPNLSASALSPLLANIQQHAHSSGLKPNFIRALIKDIPKDPEARRITNINPGVAMPAGFSSRGGQLELPGGGSRKLTLPPGAAGAKDRGKLVQLANPAALKAMESGRPANPESLVTNLKNLRPGEEQLAKSLITREPVAEPGKATSRSAPKPRLRETAKPKAAPKPAAKPAAKPAPAPAPKPAPAPQAPAPTPNWLFSGMQAPAPAPKPQAPAPAPKPQAPAPKPQAQAPKPQAAAPAAPAGKGMSPAAIAGLAGGVGLGGGYLLHKLLSRKKSKQETQAVG